MLILETFLPTVHVFAATTMIEVFLLFTIISCTRCLYKLTLTRNPYQAEIIYAILIKTKQISLLCISLDVDSYHRC